MILFNTAQPKFWVNALGDTIFTWAALRSHPQLTFRTDRLEFLSDVASFYGFSDKIDRCTRPDEGFSKCTACALQCTRFWTTFTVVQGTPEVRNGCVPSLARSYGLPYVPLNLGAAAARGHGVYLCWSSFRGGDESLSHVKLTSSAAKSLTHAEAVKIGEALSKDYIIEWHRDPLKDEELQPFNETVAALKRCRAAVCIDSGPLWLAASMGLPCLAIFTSKWAITTGYAEFLTSGWDTVTLLPYVDRNVSDLTKSIGSWLKAHVP